MVVEILRISMIERAMDAILSIRQIRRDLNHNFTFLIPDSRFNYATNPSSAIRHSTAVTM